VVQIRFQGRGRAQGLGHESAQGAGGAVSGSGGQQGHVQLIARARQGHVIQPAVFAFGFLLIGAPRRGIARVQMVDGVEAVAVFEMGLGRIAGEVGQKDHGEFQALADVHGHQHHLAAFGFLPVHVRVFIRSRCPGSRRAQIP
jgi:hypothetical protein